MNDPIREWIPAYYDGELSGAMLEMVEAHLPGCPTCQAELAELRQLSTLLKADLAASEQAAGTHTAARTANAFARDVLHHLPQQPADRWMRMWHVGVRVTPLLLLAAWAFWQAISFVSGALLTVAGLVPGGEQFLSAMMPFLGQLAGEEVGFMDLFGLLTGQTPLTPADLEAGLTALGIGSFIFAIFVVLFLGWAASWLAYTRSNQKQNG